MSGSIYTYEQPTYSGGSVAIASVSVTPSVFTLGDSIKIKVRLANQRGTATKCAVRLGHGASASTFESLTGFGTQSVTWTSSTTVRSYTATKEADTDAFAALRAALIAGSYRAANGFTAEVSLTFSNKSVVRQYYPLDLKFRFFDQRYVPAISTFSALRWDTTLDVEDDEGVSAAVTAAISTATALPDSTWFDATIRYIADDDITPATGTAVPAAASLISTGSLTNDTTSLAGVTFATGSEYSLLLTYGDEYEMAVFGPATLDSAVAVIHLAESGNGVAVGKFSAATAGNPLFECAYPATFTENVAVPDGGLFEVVSTSVSVSLPASGEMEGLATATVTPPSGFTPLCVAGYNIGNTNTHPVRVYLSASGGVYSANIYIVYTGASASITLSATVQVLCVRTSL